MSKLTVRRFPRLLLLSEAHKNARFEACQELLGIFNELGESFWSQIITVDETWLGGSPSCFQEPKSNQRNRIGKKIGLH